MHVDSRWISSLALLAAMGAAVPAAAQTRPTPRERDRGTGLPLSMFATFIVADDLIVYPFVEYYRDGDFEYSPSELGFSLDQDFRGEYRATEELIFLAYGIHDRLALEVEAAIIQARLKTSSEDPTAIADRIEESGLGDVEGQLRWRYTDERGSHPEFFGYFETVVPTQDAGSLIGTSDWEFKFGSGMIRSLSWGTVALRAAVEYDKAEDTVGVGEFAIEYLRRVARRALIYAGVEGTEDEWEAITELQLGLAPGMTLKLNNAFGVTSKATDYAPEVGIVFRWPRQ